ncbi:helix-turn-helix domain-containing protein [Sphingobacterium lactis]|uniref:helix-turn-helix domain-containing protein n=1 Tax=Sphingobacterium lactis TaxID=797291 RepID=UPI003F815317
METISFNDLPKEVAKQGEMLKEIRALLINIPTLINPPIEEDTIFTVKEASSYLGYTVKSIYVKASARQLPHHKKMGRLFFSKLELDEFIKKGKRKTLEEIQEEANQFKEKRR